MSHDIPVPRHIADIPPLRSQAELEHYWRSIMGPLGFSRPTIWMQVLDHENRVTPAVLQIDEIPRLPDSETADGLTHLLEHIGQDGGSVAFLVTRPGRRGMAPADRAWALTLATAVRRAGLRPWPVHRANDDELVVCSADDLAA